MVLIPGTSCSGSFAAVAIAPSAVPGDRRCRARAAFPRQPDGVPAFAANVVATATDRPSSEPSPDMLMTSMSLSTAHSIVDDDVGRAAQPNAHREIRPWSTPGPTVSCCPRRSWCTHRCRWPFASARRRPGDVRSRATGPSRAVSGFGSVRNRLLSGVRVGVVAVADEVDAAFDARFLVRTAPDRWRSSATLCYSGHSTRAASSHACSRCRYR